MSETGGLTQAELKAKVLYHRKLNKRRVSMKEDYQIVADWIAYEAQDRYDEIEFLLLELEKKGWKVSEEYADILELYKDKQEKFDKAVESKRSK